MEIQCEYSNPVTWENIAPVKKTDNWSFQTATCSATSSTSTMPEYISKITSSSTPDRNFYLSNTIDLGQVLMIGFFVLFFVFAVILSVFSIKNLISKKV